MVRITIHPDGPAFECESGDTILRAALRAGLGMSYSCNVGSCGNCRFELIEGAVEHARADAPAWGERDQKRNRWLGCQARPQGDCRIKFRADPGAVSRDAPALRDGTLVSVTPVTRDISEFAFRVEGADAFRPGQYALLHAPGVAGGRPYSMSNLPGEGLWRFLIKRVPGGGATGYLFDAARPGDTVKIDGPYGTAWLNEEIERDLVLLAGGSGLSPMVSIARAAAGLGRGISFYYGARAQGDLFDAGAVLGGSTGVISALSEPEPGWSGATGFLHGVVRDHLGARLSDAEIYFAGPAAMSAAVQKMAHEAGVPMDRLHFDEFY
ncbi:MAG: 2Fe-2S iron-sulfur cluster binding domain-containing protein [Rhodobacter sp.]|nr:2Fe-2S iron-sulfur cluster binding domain-containing protein [Rhodobacter sp.]